MTTLRVPAAVRQAIVAHARRELPRECCGLLIGSGSRVSHAVAMRNVARGTTRYRLDAAEHIAVRRTLRGCSPDLQIVGVYHSHPGGPACPSPTDVKEAHYPEWAHVVAGMSGRGIALRAFQIRRGHIRPLRIRA